MDGRGAHGNGTLFATRTAKPHATRAKAVSKTLPPPSGYLALLAHLDRSHFGALGWMDGWGAGWNWCSSPGRMELVSPGRPPFIIAGPGPFTSGGKVARFNRRHMHSQ